MNKINQILQDWPSNTVITTGWLKSKGIYRQLVDIYQKSGWIERIGPGAYKRKGDNLTWEGGVYALQSLQNLDIHVGGKTSLELQGKGHYLRLGKRKKVILWKKPEVRVPSWFINYDWNADIQIRSVTLFAMDSGTISPKTVDSITVKMSSAERAILEYLHDIPKYEGIDEANYIMEGLTTLRPSVLQKLLENCQSVKVTRLFMYLAEYHNHRWLRKLDPTSFNLGKGKRVIVKGGKLDKKYLITVPELSREDR